ncbi:MAG: decarboxylating NADP(+)-dependent phosphogluconate dehydrogenase [Actinobacteria bacterium]|nr:decarboxylating NADP(+)-dependent phosphogluconate dehydrogenase [Actinomycetota bacterium]MBU1494033.1 decarboxylating NADP(+)-dependent phosphogluconate dehydrogenase [Actinomycetota bacterium]MBU1865614.1 decarboxylating NADP(+)-dependent phosphogluconate dehydrogenase [Actinomycetota bacterium]
MHRTADIGLVGLAVMGQNLALNIADHGFSVAVYNRTTATTEAFVAGPAADAAIIATTTLEELVAALHRPRKVILMVKAGGPVDAVITALIPLLDAGDVIIDGGNSYYEDTIRRTAEVEAAGLLFVGTGVSGGEEGARHGPSIMPGGSPAAWPLVKGVLQAIAAKVEDGTPCCDWVGRDGAGHFVKMVHNGIEYGDMQVIAEAYDLMHRGLGMTYDEMAAVFAEWNRGRLRSYLIEITADIMAFREDGEPLLEKVLDTAGQKGTGRWTAESALRLGMPVTLVASAVFARIVSALLDQREVAAEVLQGPPAAIDGDRSAVLADLEAALYASKLVSYAQGFMLLSEAAAEHSWRLDYGAIALLWREGCIIRAAFLDEIRSAFAADPGLPNLLLDPFFRRAVEAAQPGWRRTVARAVTAGIPVPAYSSALAFFDGYRSARLPANLIQAQRDYFGAHTYQRVDRERDVFFHTDWAGTGGTAASGTYDA